ncbi:hypothetical protein SCHPADRAFT_933614 [Schizopora paradoxa]|uniref:Transmembrane protein n=1 Tax=Schizopora paradoxa TaxID=27342 RepID=A0A0H2R2A6_9AGAM|nr:hypothetical protein SCHPADRAFT_933614 [Schizopora paradoxa]
MSNESLTVVRANNTLDNTSPVFSWYPYSEGLFLGPTEGWVLWASGLGYNTSPGQSPVGDLYHVTNMPNASMSLSYYGTSLFLFGSTNCSYSVVFDNVSVPSVSPSQGMLFSKTDVPLGVHTVNLTVLPTDTSQMLLMKGATFTTEVNSSTTSPTIVNTDNQDTNLINYQPQSQWSSRTVAAVPDANDPKPFHFTNITDAWAFFEFYGRSVALYASLNYGHWLYSVELDGYEQVLNGSSFWLVPNPIVYLADGLDETQKHSLNITNLGKGKTLVFTLSSIQVTQYSTSFALAQANAPLDQTSSESSSHGKKVGAIVGGVVGGVLVFLCLASVWLYFRRKKMQASSDAGSGNEKATFLHMLFPTLHKGDDNGVTPFLNGQSSSPQSTIYWNAPLATYGQDDASRANKSTALASLPLGSGDCKTPAVSTSRPIPVIMRKEPPPVIPRITHPYNRDTADDAGISQGGSMVRLEDSVAAVASPSSTHAEAPASEPLSTTGSVMSDPNLVRRVLDLVTQRIDRPLDGNGTYSSDGASHLAVNGSGGLPSYELSAAASTSGGLGSRSS